jgi:hypothetical protein
VVELFCKWSYDEPNKYEKRSINALAELYRKANEIDHKKYTEIKPRLNDLDIIMDCDL